MKAIIGAVVSVVLTAPVNGPSTAQNAPDGTKARSTVEIQVCNRSGRGASVAVSYVEIGSGQFINRGWYDVADGACSQLASTDNAKFYMYADATDGSGRTWRGDHTLCVEYPGPYTFLSTGSSTCDLGQETRNFVSMHAGEPGPYVWTLNP